LAPLRKPTACAVHHERVTETSSIAYDARGQKWVSVTERARQDQHIRVRPVGRSLAVRVPLTVGPGIQPPPPLGYDRQRDPPSPDQHPANGAARTLPNDNATR